MTVNFITSIYIAPLQVGLLNLDQAYHFLDRG